MKRNKGHAKRKGGTLGFGLLISVLVYVISVAVTALILGAVKNPLAGIGIASTAALFSSAFLSGFIISKKKGDGGVPLSVISSLILMLILFICCAVLNHGKIPIATVACYASYVIISAIGAIVARKSGSRRRRHG